MNKVLLWVIRSTDDLVECQSLAADFDSANCDWNVSIICLKHEMIYGRTGVENGPGILSKSMKDASTSCLTFVEGCQLLLQLCPSQVVQLVCIYNEFWNQDTVLDFFQICHCLKSLLPQANVSVISNILPNDAFQKYANVMGLEMYHLPTLPLSVLSRCVWRGQLYDEHQCLLCDINPVTASILSDEIVPYLSDDSHFLYGIEILQNFRSIEPSTLLLLQNSPRAKLCLRASTLANHAAHISAVSSSPIVYLLRTIYARKKKDESYEENLFYNRTTKFVPADLQQGTLLLLCATNCNEYTTINNNEIYFNIYPVQHPKQWSIGMNIANFCTSRDSQQWIESIADYQCGQMNQTSEPAIDKIAASSTDAFGKTPASQLKQRLLSFDWAFLRSSLYLSTYCHLKASSKANECQYFDYDSIREFVLCAQDLSADIAFGKNSSCLREKFQRMRYSEQQKKWIHGTDFDVKGRTLPVIVNEMSIDLENECNGFFNCNIQAAQVNQPLLERKNKDLIKLCVVKMLKRANITTKHVDFRETYKLVYAQSQYQLRKLIREKLLHVEEIEQATKSALKTTIK